MGGGMLPRRLHPTVIDKAFKRLDVLCPLGTLRSPPLYLLITFPDSLRILWGNECASGGTAHLKKKRRRFNCIYSTPKLEGGMFPRRLHPAVIDKAFKRLDVLCPLGTLRSPPLYLLITFPDSLRILWGNECASGGTAHLKKKRK
ncbi:hypothetical protein CDAR_94361 [Caerostris darwini]|uniref:Uncharacterized protein n=1 Tax=Caerostris darwini TaxID=1538125 RepID=A0AAV4VNW0_9ARAC|nr:hypothetical protein CDAR_94361 [Caerostris darwini]